MPEDDEHKHKHRFRCDKSWLIPLLLVFALVVIGVIIFLCCGYQKDGAAATDKPKTASTKTTSTTTTMTDTNEGPGGGFGRILEFGVESEFV